MRQTCTSGLISRAIVLWLPVFVTLIVSFSIPTRGEENVSCGCSAVKQTLDQVLAEKALDDVKMLKRCRCAVSSKGVRAKLDELVLACSRRVTDYQTSFVSDSIWRRTCSLLDQLISEQRGITLIKRGGEKCESKLSC